MPSLGHHDMKSPIPYIQQLIITGLGVFRLGTAEVDLQTWIFNLALVPLEIYCAGTISKKGTRENSASRFFNLFQFVDTVTVTVVNPGREQSLDTNIIAR